jgi:hypothetical protein
LPVEVLQFFVRLLQPDPASGGIRLVHPQLVLDRSGPRPRTTATKGMLQMSFAPTDLTNELVLLRVEVK